MAQEGVIPLQEYFLLNATNIQNFCLYVELNHFHGCAGFSSSLGSLR